MPPPASQMVKANGLWSRPLLPWLQGIRPNSVVQMDDRVVEQAARLQVLDQCRGGLVQRRAMFAVVLGEVLVAVPVPAREAVVGAAPHLNEADATLQQTPRDEAVASEVLRHLGVEAVELRVASDSPAMSSTSGALNCSRAAIS